MMTVAHNLVAMNAQRQFNNVGIAKAKSTEKLSSGYKINRAADDSAGLAISEKMRRQIRGLSQASSNVEEGIGYVQTADGALAESQEILQRMNQLAVKACNATLSSSDRRDIDSEIKELKGELSRIFGTTTFNDRPIWNVNSTDRKVIGSFKQQAAEYVDNYHTYLPTNEGVGRTPNDSISVSASEKDGVSFSWTGYDGKKYTTEAISMDDFRKNGFSVNLSSLYKNAKVEWTGADGVAKEEKANLFYPDNKTPVFDTTISLSVAEDATNAQVAASINGNNLPAYTSVYMSAGFENSDGTTDVTRPIRYYSASLNTQAAYNSSTNGTEGKRYSFEDAVDTFIKPKDATFNVTHPAYTGLDDAKSSSETFSLKFEMEGVGEVTGSLMGLEWRAYDNSSAAKGVWWDTDSYGIFRTQKQSFSNYDAITKMNKPIEMQQIFKSLTNYTDDKGKVHYGVLGTDQGGYNNNLSSTSAGYMDFSFNLTDTKGQAVGNITFRMDINNKIQDTPGGAYRTMTLQDVYNKIVDTFNDSAIVDAQTTDWNVRTNHSRVEYYYNYATTNEIDQNVYQSTNKFFVQAGAEANQHIDIQYDALTDYVLGIHNTSVDTIENAEKAIGEVKNALDIISGQRSDFGAYQNRLEHSVKNLNNVTENTQSAESLIRDTDMAKEMVNYSLKNILAQAGQSMMAQANQSNQGVLNLLG